jgi:LacI family transcriptional regulator
MSITRVAKLAGVSSSTVSRVINNHPRVAPATAEAVRKVMLKLGYVPSENRPGPKPARSNRGSQEGCRLLVFGTIHRPGYNTPGFDLLMQGVASAAQRYSADLIFTNLPDNAEDFAQRLAQQRVNGVFLGGVYPPELRQRLQTYPCIFLMGNRRRPDFGDQVMQDAYGVGELAAAYLVSRGHTRLAFLNLDSDHWAIHLYGHAFEYTARARGAQIVAVETAKRQTGFNWRDFAPETVDHIVRSYLSLSPRPTGLFVAEDAQTALVQPALQRAGVEVGPGKVEIVSCNNERPYLAGLSPMPATVDIRVATIGERGLEQLMRRIGQSGVARDERVISLVQPKLVLPDGNYAEGDFSPEV